jgi:hypothetical protein
MALSSPEVPQVRASMTDGSSPISKICAVYSWMDKKKKRIDTNPMVKRDVLIA